MVFSHRNVDREHSRDVRLILEFQVDFRGVMSWPEKRMSLGKPHEKYALIRGDCQYEKALKAE